MTETRRVPSIRFKGFTDVWEQRKLGDTVDFYSGLTYSPADVVNGYGVLVLRSSNVQDGEIIDEDNVYVRDSAVNSDNVNVGDIVVVVRNGSRSLIGKHAKIKKNMFKTVIGAFMTGLRYKNSSYLNTVLNTSIFEIEIEKNLGATINQITTGAFKKMEFPFPKQLEQVRIGDLFEQLDNLITLHQRKCDKIKNIKVALLEKMFPQDGQTTPSIRFKGFTDVWEQRKLGEIGKAQSGVGFPDYEQGGQIGVPFYKVSDMNNYGNEHEMLNANNYVSDEQCKRNGWIPITEISVLFAKVGAAIMLNRKRLVRNSFLLDNNTMAYKFGNEWNINFGKTMFEKIDLTALVQIGALPSYNATDIENIKIFMPNKQEQEEIGKLFFNLDTLITLHQRKVEKLKNIKSALLEKMFV